MNRTHTPPGEPLRCAGEPPEGGNRQAQHGQVDLLPSEHVLHLPGCLPAGAKDGHPLALLGGRGVTGSRCSSIHASLALVILKASAASQAGTGTIVGDKAPCVSPVPDGLLEERERTSRDKGMLR